MSRLRTVYSVIALIIASAIATPAFGQGFDLSELQLPDELNQIALNSTPKLGIKVQSHVAMTSGNVGLLTIEVSLNDKWKIYSLSHPAGGPLPTKIHLQPNNGYRLLGSFSPNHPPKIEYSNEFEMDVETFKKSVSWSVPIQFKDPVTAGTVELQGYLEGLACAGQCVPFGKSETLFHSVVTQSTLAGLDAARVDGTHVNVRSWLSESQAKPGDSVQLFVSFDPDPGYHVYSYQDQPSSVYKATLVQSKLPSGWKQGSGKSSGTLVSKSIANDLYREYVGPVTIAVPIKIPLSAHPGEQSLSGNVAFQSCADTTCDQPLALTWTSRVRVVDSVANSSLGLVRFGPTMGYTEVATALQKPEAVETVSQHQDNSTANQIAPGVGAIDLSSIDFAEDTNTPNTNLATAIMMALAGGFILNFMPCVLPVIGLKIMSFVEQAGSDRKRVFQLNLWYVFGILTIFWVLAAFAVAGIGWGEQFNNQTFAISLLSLVFVMALSFLGVWEIPIPGFATSKSATDLSTKEDIGGAFFKGVITTLLATPCSAPIFGVAYGFAVNSGSTFISFLIFTATGLGMGLPYLLIGAFPSLIRFLPKPGVWMDTFKQLMGFVLLGTVIFLLQNVSFSNLLPTIGLLFGLWFACWWIGSVPFTAAPDERMRAWAISAIIGMAAVAGSFSQHGLISHAAEKYARSVDREISQRLEQVDGATAISSATHNENSLPWEPFSNKSLQQMVSQGETVMVDFTADWCLTCRRLESGVLNTKPIRDAVQQKGIRTVVADWGTKDEAIGDLLDKLQGSRSIPFLAIFPAGHPEQVIRFSGNYTKNTLLDALDKAGASRSNEISSTAMPVPEKTRPTLIMSQLP